MMRTSRAVTPLVLVPVAVALSSPAPAAQVEPTNTYILEFAGDIADDLAEMVAAAGGVLHRVHDQIGIASAISDDPDFASFLSAEPGISRVTQDLIVEWTPDDASLIEQPLATPEGHAPVPGPAGAFFRSCQWNLDRIDAPGAWAQDEFGDPDVKVAVLDSGIDPDHFDLLGKVDLASSATFVTASPCGVADTASFVDRRWHGTFVASQIATNNFGIAGVAPLATLVAVKVFRCDGTGSFDDIIAGIVYAASLPDVDVINMSLGAWFPKNTPGGGALVGALNEAVNFANAQGKLVVSAAGNDARNLDRDRSGTSVPAQSGAAISVYATTNDDDLASYSNFGRSGTWLGAPGGDLPNAMPPLPGCLVNPALQSLVLGACSSASVVQPCGPASYLLGPGTSFAAPLVSGVAALVDGKASNAGALNGGQLKTILTNTADDLGRPEVDLYFSHGRVNAANAVR